MMTALQQTSIDDMPDEVMWKILFHSVVNMAHESDADFSVEKSLTHHALVCYNWSEIVHDPRFREQVHRRVDAMGA